MSCEYCKQRQYYTYKLEDRIRDLEADLLKVERAQRKAEGEANSLRPYKEASDRAYDVYVSNPKGMP